MVQLAAALWAARDLSFTSGYEDLARQIFGAESANLDFGSPSAVATMNAWVRANTAGYITDLFSTIDPLTVLCGATTLVFRGVWQAPFDRHWTRMGSFTRQDREPVLVPFMHQIGRFPYYEDDRVQAVALPIQHAPTDGREFDLIIILPKDPIPLVSLQSDLAAATRWSAWLACLDYVHRYRMLPYGLLAVPRFTITYGSQPNLNATLGALSIKHLFNPASADLTAMLVSPSSTPLPVFLSSLLHRTLLSVEEKGVTAAAASGVIYETGSPPPLNFVMQVDRPFLCAIWERTSELLLFLGAVNDPSNQP
jgi:serpin B